MHDTLIYHGGSVKVLDETEGEVKVGGPLVVFGGEDLEGEFFTPDTYFGAQAKASPDGFVLDAMYNHGIVTSPQLKALAEHEFMPLEASKTDTGIMASIILRERDEYEAMLAEMAKAGKLGWSSGSAPHAVRKSANGEIKRWPLIEGSLTPTPAEARTSAVPLKSLMEQAGGSEDHAREILKSLRDIRKQIAAPYPSASAGDIASSIRTITQSIQA